MADDSGLLTAFSEPPGAPQAPAGWRPQRVIGSTAFELTTTAREVPDGNASPISAEEQAELLRSHDMDPQQWVVTSFGSSRWQTQSGKWLEASRIKGRPRVASPLFGQDMPDLDDIDAAVGRITRTAPPSSFGLNPDLTNVGVLADLQVGKTNHRGGTEELLARVNESLEAWTDQILLQRPAEIVLLDAGDPIENFESAGEQERTNDLGLTEQIRVWRRIFWKYVERAASLAPVVHVAAVGSNHGRVRRGKAALGHASEDYGIEVLAQISDMAAVNPDKYGHVKFWTPGKFDESLALQLAGGKTLGLVHGHQVSRATALDGWWAKQSHGRGPVADADILVAGHFHAFHVLPSGADRWIFVAPTSDNGSAWFRNISGKENAPGVLSFAVDPLGWRGMALV